MLGKDSQSDQAKDGADVQKYSSRNRLLPIVPVRLRHLGFTQHLSPDTFVIIPPTCDIPANSYLIGCPAFIRQTEGGSVEGYEVQGTLYIDAFVIGMFPVTVAEFACAVQAGAIGEVPKVAKRLSWCEQLKHPDYPVVGITWDEAHRYAQWLTLLTSVSWRLPTEIEWEAAARGPHSYIYPWADDWQLKRANLGENGGVMAIGMYPDGASEFGVHELSGNVAEWTQSMYRPYPYRASDGRERDDIPGNRVQRGGSYLSSEHTVRAYMRFGNAPEHRGRDVGFRLARSASAISTVAEAERAKYEE